MTMSDLARVSGVKSSTIYAWEAGTFTPRVDKLAAVMKVLGSPIEHVVVLPIDQRFPGDWRVLCGLTQSQLALAAGVTAAKLQRIECGESAPTDEQVQILSRLLGTTVEEYGAAWRRVRERPPGAPA
jgi:transcriptional regulator with XRE-family HTH domain